MTTNGPISTDDRLALHELAARYANTIDARDWPAFETVFTPDCRYELRNFGRLDTVIRTAAALRSFMEESLTHPVAHHVTNVEVRADGDVVRMFSKVLGPMNTNTTGSADYHDIVVHNAAGWQISDRTVTLRRPPKA